MTGRPFTQQIGPVRADFGPDPYPRLTVDGLDPGLDGRPRTVAQAVIDRNEATDLRNWLNEFLDDGGGS